MEPSEALATVVRMHVSAIYTPDCSLVVLWSIALVETAVKILYATAMVGRTDSALTLPLLSFIYRRISIGHLDCLRPFNFVQLKYVLLASRLENKPSTQWEHFTHLEKLLAKVDTNTPLGKNTNFARRVLMEVTRVSRKVL